MLNKEELLKDLDILKACQANEDYLKKKYNIDTLYMLDEVIKACAACNVEPGVITRPYAGYYAIKLKRKKGEYDFVVQHNKCYRLTNTATHYKQDKDKWYIRFTCNGIGRLGMYNRPDFVYSETANQIWQEFIDTIKGYGVLDYDEWNEEFLFDIENGMKLYNDFESIYTKAYEGLRKDALEQQKQRLQNQLDELEQDGAL